MGAIVLAAKMTHVPTLLMSEQPGRIEGKRQAAIEGHYEIARRAKALGADTVVICDTHWLVNAGYHINANHHFETLSSFSLLVDAVQEIVDGYAIDLIVAGTKGASGMEEVSEVITGTPTDSASMTGMPKPSY